MLVFYCKPRNGKLLDPIPKEFLIVEDIFSVPHVDSILSESFLRKGGGCTRTGENPGIAKIGLTPTPPNPGTRI